MKFLQKSMTWLLQLHCIIVFVIVAHFLFLCWKSSKSPVTKKGEATVMLKNILQFKLTLQCLNPQSRFAPEYVCNTKLN